ncbi:MAG TPA: type III-B CRISPR module RAMP protein Cmr4 [Chitinophagales bacterium]|nr:type III-B CRISPR module RAMP protein Cmr4 [Chitinophagales bacterium]
MFKIANPLFIQCLTPTHVGSGSDLGIVDLPIQREGHTNYPKFEASSLKGALRQRFEEKYSSNDNENKEKIHLTFGYDPQGECKKFKDAYEAKYAKEYSGALGFTDARLLFFPIKSMKGVYALVTSVGILEKFVAELELSTLETAMQEDLTSLDAEVQKMDLKPGECYSVEGKCITEGDKTSIILEEYAFVVKSSADNPNLVKISNSIKKISDFEISKHLVVLHDDDFRDFVELSTEVITRIKIKNSTGVVEGGALFTEEYLPSETILYSLVLASPVFQEKTAKFKTFEENRNEIEKEFKTETDVMDFFTNSLTKANNILQIGNNTTLGKGIVKIYLPQNEDWSCQQ